MKNLLWSLIAFFSFNVWAVQGPSAQFDTDKTEVINTKQILSFANDIKDKAEKIILICHTDSRNPTQYNIELAGRRCQSVTKMLTSLGISIQSMVALGEESLIVAEDVKKFTDKHGRMGVNRAVEIFFELSPELKVGKTTVIYKDKIVEKLTLRHHHLQLLGGYGASGLNRDEETIAYPIRTDYVTLRNGMLGGASYDYLFESGLSLGVKGITSLKFQNLTGLLGVGYVW